MKIRADNFVENLVKYYRGDHLILQSKKCVSTNKDTSNTNYEIPQDFVGLNSLPCDNTIEPLEEVNAIENWKNQGSISKPRSSKSFLVKQQGFENINLNERGPICEIALLKNGSSYNNKPLFVHGFDKVLLSNTCSADSLLSILAVAAAESKHYNQFLSNTKNETAKFVLRMIGNRPSKEMYKNRVYLLAQHFITRTVDWRYYFI
ncbi:unnamed protein product [Macrosiphum euphorbiae]|uniref:LAGLIDADG homing endonuclease n=1 Tax=Macrosiphum euphorbiae TaxID=13131 RepID=A0AAV0WH55_9HEMI|nr:unnamed protein product [Macrosiphum euphorbiae]